MPTATLLKATRDTNLWRKGQKMWIIFNTGALAAYVKGKYKGKGRWIKGWAHWGASANPGKSFSCKPDCRYIGEVEISDEFNSLLQKYRW